MHICPAILVNVLSIFYIWRTLSRNPSINPSKTKSDIQDYYILNLKDPMYISMVMNAWMWHCSSHANDRKSAQFLVLLE